MSLAHNLNERSHRCSVGCLSVPRRAAAMRLAQKLDERATEARRVLSASTGALA